jgi:hypothetical protein
LFVCGLVGDIVERIYICGQMEINVEDILIKMAEYWIQKIIPRDFSFTLADLPTSANYTKSQHCPCSSKFHV